MINLTDPIFTDENAARAHFEAIRWPNGKRSCPHCGAVGESTELHGKSHRPGLYQCNGCREHFTVKVGGVMESSHIPLTKWAAGFSSMPPRRKASQPTSSTGCLGSLTRPLGSWLCASARP